MSALERRKLTKELKNKERNKDTQMKFQTEGVNLTLNKEERNCGC